MGSITKLMNLFGTTKSADHLAGDWNAGAYLLDEGSEGAGFNSLPAMLVDAQSNSALVELSWVPLPSYAPIASCAYMLSTRRI